MSAGDWICIIKHVVILIPGRTLIDEYPKKAGDEQMYAVGWFEGEIHNVL